MVPSEWLRRSGRRGRGVSLALLRNVREAGAVERQQTLNSVVCAWLAEDDLINIVEAA
jgi:hypothetical protein